MYSYLLLGQNQTNAIFFAFQRLKSKVVCSLGLSTLHPPHHPRAWNCRMLRQSAGSGSLLSGTGSTSCCFASFFWEKWHPQKTWAVWVVLGIHRLILEGQGYNRFQKVNKTSPCTSRSIRPFHRSLHRSWGAAISNRSKLGDSGFRPREGVVF